jgi:hypothetical protein
MPQRHISCLIKYNVLREWRYGSMHFSTRWRLSGQLHAQLLYLWDKSPQYPMGRRLGGSQSQSACSDEKKPIISPAGN